MTDRFFCPRGPGADSPFNAPFNGEATWQEDRTCSYCGSLHPDVLFEQIEKGAQFGPTDKSHKVYVHLIDHVVRGAGKFYFQHLDQSQRGKFIELLNAGAVNIGYPGHFYVLPFFAMRAPSAG
ncbi:hypothetical protein M527_07070 [Sphingobium indicum IP26]|uniref:Uncharacterized protein n=1 Tax=Sphingobium indicum F2 TaxID=1450518 RepID=A0A8E0WT22_9SPHN|nr:MULTISPECIES: hypothetical protein [Sphingobium]EPR09880.1 hypothetical protein M527_07070 [Sphingobium indicum IP26]EQB05008.1 hypothetical protein L286_09585 [Sphingobium sp. HDIP04]KER36675.1 hypothetical protein AL00_09375 [Sphingobium indicum F2]